MSQSDREQRISILILLDEEARRLQECKDDVEVWVKRVSASLRRLFGEHSREHADFDQIDFRGPFIDEIGYFDESNHRGPGLFEARSSLLGWIQTERDFGVTPSEQSSTTGKRIAIEVCEGFHRAAIRLRKRTRDRAPLSINDEWDAQYLFGALLAVHFDDVVAEDPVPTAVGGSSRIDFVLPQHGIGIELKFARDEFGENPIGKQLLVDICRYSSHPQVRTLICLIYDPHHHTDNPRKLEADLEEQSSDGLTVVALVRPAR